MALLRDEYLLEPGVVFLNHGSFGACPRPVFEAYQRWQLELERDPVHFIGRRVRPLLSASRATLGAYLNVAADEVVYFPNPTSALNMVIRSLVLGEHAPVRPGDEILSTDHEYGAVDRTWEFCCRKGGAVHVKFPMPLPMGTPEEFVDRLWSAVNSRTRVIAISHITSPTALTFPVAEICRRARAAGILTVIDGAHAVSQLPLDLTALGADFYAGACHKWLCAPKGSSFVYARRELHHLLEPLIVSWGWSNDGSDVSHYIDHHEWQGTRDLSAYLAVPDAIAYQAGHDWDQVRAGCHALAVETRARLADLFGLPQVCPEGMGWYSQMFTAPLPDVDTGRLGQRLWEENHIEVPVLRFKGQPLIRISLQEYNTEGDVETLLEALKSCI